MLSGHGFVSGRHWNMVGAHIVPTPQSSARSGHSVRSSPAAKQQQMREVDMEVCDASQVDDDEGFAEHVVPDWNGA